MTASPAIDLLLAASLGDDEGMSWAGHDRSAKSRSSRSQLPQARAPLSADEEPGLLLRLRGDNDTVAQSAFSALYDAYVHPLWRFATRLTGSASVAEEIVQDVFTRIWTHRRSWNPPGGVATYVFRAVRNQAIDLNRHANVAGRIMPVEGEGDHNAVVPGHGEAPIAPDAEPLAAELRRVVQQAVGALPERRRTALVLRYVHGMSYAQVAEVLEISEKNAFALVSRAQEALRPVLAKFFEDVV